MKKLISIASCIWLTSISPSTSFYKNTQLYFSPISKQRLSNLKKEELPVFAVLVPSNVKAPSTAVKNLHNLFSESLQIPASFFTDKRPTQNTLPICLTFDWIDKNEGAINLKLSADKLASNLVQLKKDFKNAKLIVISLGRGGLLANKVTQSSVCPKLDAIIELGTPIPSSAKTNLYPNPAKVTNFYNLTTDLPYSFSHPRIHTGQDDQRQYPPIKNFHPYQIRLIMNGQQVSIQKELFIPNEAGKKNCQLLGSQLFSLCKKASTDYSHYRSVWAAISKQQNANVLMGLMKKPGISKPTQQELARNAVNSQAYEKQYGSLSQGLRASERQKFNTLYKTAAHNPRYRLQKFARQTA